MKKSSKILIWIILIAGAATFAEFFLLRKNTKLPAPQTQNNIFESKQTEVPVATESVIPEIDPENNPVPSPTPIPESPPEKFILDMPFYSQAPSGNWDKVHEEMCEEASVLNGGLYLLDIRPTKDEFEKDLMAIKKIEEKLFNDYESTTISQTKQFTDQYFDGKLQTKILNNPTIENIENEISAGHPVIVPLAGRDIDNPNFTPPGPVYHMLVIKGYDTQNFITNDVGTRKGASYTYKKEVIMKNIYDWNKNDIYLGEKKALVLYK